MNTFKKFSNFNKLKCNKKRDYKGILKQNLRAELFSQRIKMLGEFQESKEVNEINDWKKSRRTSVFSAFSSNCFFFF